jgi:glycosyltransferase involved in cell wall biosynthesis
MTKILLIIENISFGGKERQFVELGRNLCRNKKFDVYFVLFYDVVEYDISWIDREKLIILNARNKLQLFKSLVCTIRKVQPDIIHSWETISPVASYFSALFKKPAIVNGSIRYAAKFKPFSKQNILAKLSFIVSDKIIANSSKGLENSGLTQSSKSTVIYNGIDLKKFEVADLINNKKYDLVCIANLLPSKDHETLIKSVVRFCNEIKPISLLLVGDGPRLKELQQLVPDHLKHLIIFHGKSQNVYPYISKSRIGVLLTNDRLSAEGISNSIMEYMAAGLPVIATYGGGTPELVNNGHNGFLIPPHDENAFMSKIRLLLDNEELCQVKGRHSRSIIEQKFSADGMVLKYIEVYHDVIKKTKTNR